MKKVDFVKKIADASGLTQKDAKKFLEGLQDVVYENIGDDSDGIPLMDGLKLKVVTRAARTCRNPQTGDAMEVPERVVPVVKVYPKLKKAVAEKFY